MVIKFRDASGDGVWGNDASSNSPLVAVCRGASKSGIVLGLRRDRGASETACPSLSCVLVARVS